MSVLEDRKTSPNSPLKKRTPSRSDSWHKKNTNSLKHMISHMPLQYLSTPTTDPKSKTKTLNISFSTMDRTRLLTDELLFNILSRMPRSQINPNSLVCKRWLNLQGRIVRTLKVLDWEFLQSGRLALRFPNLTHVDLVYGCLLSHRNPSVIMLSHGMISIPIDSGVSPEWKFCQENFLPVETVDRGLETLSSKCPNLRKLSVINASELGLLSVGEECLTLQELELHKCDDNLLRGIAACRNLQVLKLVGNLDGLYSSVVSDIGLTILAQGCKRLVKLELSGCEGSFDGIKAIGQCCQMLEELTLCDHRMDAGWLAALSYCENLKILKILSCKAIDPSPGPDEYLGSCPALEHLHLQKCQLGDKKSIRALFRICENVRVVDFQDCWGLDDDIFSLAKVLRRAKILSLERCSLLTTAGLESTIMSWQELQSLSVFSCNNIKDSDISPALSTLFSSLKELKWRPDTKSHLASNLVGMDIGKRGRKFLKKT